MRGHRILIELDQEQEALLREIAEHDGVSMSYAASQMFGDYLIKLKPLMPVIKADLEAEQNEQ